MDMMELSYIKKFLVVCTMTFFTMSFAILENHIVVKAEDAISVTSVDSDIGFKESGKEYSGVVEGGTTKWMDIKDVFSSVFTEMLGACLGLLSAIALANRSNRKLMKELDSSLLKELSGIKKELRERLNDGFEDYYCYQTPIWDINLESGSLALVSNSKVFNKYIEIYSKIQYAKGLESEYIHAKLFRGAGEDDGFTEKYIGTIDKARKREAQEIHNYIDNLN